MSALVVCASAPAALLDAVVLVVAGHGCLPARRSYVKTPGTSCGYTEPPDLAAAKPAWAAAGEAESVDLGRQRVGDRSGRHRHIVANRSGVVSRCATAKQILPTSAKSRDCLRPGSGPCAATSSRDDSGRSRHRAARRSAIRQPSPHLAATVNGRRLRRVAGAPASARALAARSSHAASHVVCTTRPWSRSKKRSTRSPRGGIDDAGRQPVPERGRAGHGRHSRLLLDRLGRARRSS